MAIVLSISKHFGAVNALSKSLVRLFFLWLYLKYKTMPNHPSP
jgi:hypothetical protein